MTRPRLRKIARYVGLGLVALGGVCTVRAMMMSPPDLPPPPEVALPTFDASITARKLGEALAIETVSLPSGGTDAAFERLHAHLVETFPRVHATLTVESVGHSRLYTWPGSDPSLPALLLVAHLDVVPVEPGTEGDWTHPPFAGRVDGGKIWGRGALDDKTSVIAILEAAEALLSEGFAPTRTIVLALGHDEEVGGNEGAAKLAAKLQARGQPVAFVLDEGGIIVEGALPGIDPPVAFVGIAEKGYATFRLTLSGEGGHSSMPPSRGAIGRLGEAVAALEDEQMDARLDGPTRTMIETLAPHMGLVPRLALANLWLLDGVVARALTRDPAAAASVRTTTAPTVFSAGSADNVLAQNATAIVNFRILPEDTVESVRAHVVDVIDDEAIGVECIGDCRDPSRTSPVDAEGFTAVRDAVRRTFDGVIVAPYLVVGGTDARHYEALSPQVYRFLPLRIRKDERAMIHGTDEHVKADALADAVRFYAGLVLDVAG